MGRKEDEADERYDKGLQRAKKDKDEFNEWAIRQRDKAKAEADRVRSIGYLRDPRAAEEIYHDAIWRANVNFQEAFKEANDTLLATAKWLAEERDKALPKKKK